MKDLFVPYEESLALKELGFDEPCFGSWEVEKSDIPTYTHSISLFYTNSTHPINKVTVPLYQQVFRWFRDKYYLHAEPVWDNDDGTYWFFSITKIGNLEFNAIDLDMVETYEEAELACLKKLIELVKKK